MRLAGLAALTLALLVAACSKPDVAYDGATFQAKGWRGPSPPVWTDAFAVYAGETQGAPPMIGDYRKIGSTIRFTPRFRPDPGLRLLAVYRPDSGPPIRRSFTQPGAAKAGAAPTVAAIYPTTEILPENQLKLYVEFSKPMQRGQAWRHLQLRDDKGAVIELPFVEIDQELWDPEGRRLTILFDPGRIKREVLPNRDVGAPLIPGRRYSFVVLKGFPAADGGALAADVAKSFSVTPAERRPIVLADWRIAPPKPGTRDPLVIRFPRPLDRALLADSLHVLKDGKSVGGAVAVGDQETVWRFTPEREWGQGAYELSVETRIEDLAGNRIGRAFDVDTLADNQPRIVDKSKALPFRVG